MLDAGDVKKNEKQSLLLKSFYFCGKDSTWQNVLISIMGLKDSGVSFYLKV